MFVVHVVYAKQVLTCIGQIYVTTTDAHGLYFSGGFGGVTYIDSQRPYSDYSTDSIVNLVQKM